eukprot:3394958-Rhodomonas_salina.1
MTASVYLALSFNLSLPPALSPALSSANACALSCSRDQHISLRLSSPAQAAAAEMSTTLILRNQASLIGTHNPSPMLYAMRMRPSNDVCSCL